MMDEKMEDPLRIALHKIHGIARVKTNETMTFFCKEWMTVQVICDNALNPPSQSITKEADDDN